MNDIEKVVIIGAGPAGLTAGIYASRAGLSPLIIEGHEPGGQLVSTSGVENWPGEISILGPELIKKMRTHALSLGCRFVGDDVVKAELNQKPFKVTLKNETVITTGSIIIATGAQPKKLNCPGESLFWGRGVSTCAICDGPFFKDKRVVVVGGGDSAMETASFLASFTPYITIVHILPQLTASHAMQQRVLKNSSINIIYETTVQQISGINGKVSEVTLINPKNGVVTTLPTNGVFINIGLTPTTALFKGQLAMDSYGYLTLKNTTETSIEGVFAAGDVADKRYRQAITSAGTGCAAALDAERYLKDHNLY